MTLVVTVTVFSLVDFTRIRITPYALHSFVLKNILPSYPRYVRQLIISSRTSRTARIDHIREVWHIKSSGVTRRPTSQYRVHFFCLFYSSGRQTSEEGQKSFNLRRQVRRAKEKIRLEELGRACAKKFA